MAELDAGSTEGGDRCVNFLFLVPAFFAVSTQY